MTTIHRLARVYLVVPLEESRDALYLALSVWQLKPFNFHLRWLLGEDSPVRASHFGGEKADSQEIQKGFPKAGNRF